MNVLLMKLLGQGLAMPPEDGVSAGAAAAPVAAPVAAPSVPDGGTPAPDTAPSISEKDMTALLNDDDIVGDPAPAVAPAPPAAPPGVAPPAVPPVVQAPAVPPQVPPVAQPPAAPSVTPAAPVAPVAPAAPATPEAPAAAPTTPAAPTPESLEAQRAQSLARRTEYVKQLETAYAMPEKDALEFAANPAAGLPKLAAKLHVDVLESAIHGIMMQMPQVIEGFMQRREATAKNESEFYGTWPMLDKGNAQHRGTVESLMRAIVQGNPGIKRVDAIKQVGAAALVALGIPYDAPRVAAAPIAPAAPVIPPVAGFSPALPGVGGLGVPGAPAGSSNPFENLSREFEEDV